MKTEKIEYIDKGTTCVAHVAYDETISGKRPAVLIAHAWAGREPFEDQKAEALAKLGYVGFALDNYGGGQIGTSVEENTALMTPFLEDRAMLRQRLNAGLNAAKQLAVVDSSKIAAMGFCFGGLCVLDMARAGVDLKGVVSFHGLLNAPENIPNGTIKAKVMVLHGHDDPMVSPEAVLTFEKEMTEAKVDWQLHAYGGTMHSFTSPAANDPGFGTVYNKAADQRSWHSMKNFFEEIFA